MRYWLLTTEFPPFYGGGISTYCKHTVEMLQQKGHAVTVFVPDFTVSGIQEGEITGVRVVRFLPRQTGTHQFLGYAANLSYEFAAVVKKYLEKEGAPEILESQEYQGIAYYTQQFKLLGYPLFRELNILITCHAPEFVYLEYNHVPVYKLPIFWTAQMEKSSIRSADILISPSRYIVSEIKQKMSWEGISEKIIFNPIACNSRLNASPDFVAGSIVCFGKLAPLKGTFALLKFFETLWKTGKKLKLQIIGGTDLVFHPEAETMGNLVRSRYKQYILEGLLVLHEEKAPEAARKMLLEAHVILVPSLVDNLPYTVLEAMSWGKVVLASRQGGQSEVIENGINGFLFDHKTVGDFQEKLLHILSLPETEIKAIGSNAAAHIRQNFAPEVIYDKKFETINSFLKSPKERKNFPFVSPVSETEIVSQKSGNPVLLSVVIPYFNMGPYIEACVKSIVASNYPEKEILIINDGSTDPESEAKLKYLEEKYPVKVFNKPNTGLSDTRNFGAEKANGYFLAFLDADDTVLPDYYPKAINVLKQYQNVHFVGCWVQYFEGNNAIWPAFNPEPPFLLAHNMVNSSALVYNKASFLRTGLNDAALVYGMEDWDSVISMVANGYGGVVLPEVLYNYRVRQGSMARSFTKVKKLFLHKHITEKHATFYQQHAVELTHLLTCNGSGLDYDNPTFEVSSNYFMPFSGVLKDRLKNRVKRNRILRKVALKIYKKLK